MYTKGAKGWAKHIDFIIWDMICLILSFFVSYFARHGVYNPLKSELYREMLVVFVLIDFFGIIFLDTMKNVLKRGLYKEFSATIAQSVLLLLCSTMYMFSTKVAGEYSRIAIYTMIGIYTVLTYIIRLFWKQHILSRLKDKPLNSLLIMASEKTAPMIMEEVRSNNFGKHRLTGLVVHDAYKIGKQVDGVPIVATFETLLDYIINHWVDEVLISVNPGEPLPEETVDALTAMGVTVHINMEKSGHRVGVKQTIGNIGRLLVITSSMNYMTTRQAAAKRLMDIAGGIVGCIITGILYIFLAPIIKKQSPGPVFFKQERIGRNGKPFTLYKFRSMYLDAEERKAELMEQNRVNDGLMFKLEFDPRVIGNRIDENGQQKTGIGEFIRKFSLDEFPQFYNVLRGDMSLVGTRPPLPNEVSLYEAHHKARLAARPGITGLWQVSGRSEITDFEEVVRLDTEYINNWSIGLDVKILVKTVMVVLKKEGSM